MSMRIIENIKIPLKKPPGRRGKYIFKADELELEFGSNSEYSL